ncbi:hypothetical protein C2S52_014778 [Perilla frutescens var. hirtella]|nr:hypothetical protein C2S52_014778 [Perilla frutescens var. hirtella]
MMNTECSKRKRWKSENVSTHIDEKEVRRILSIGILERLQNEQSRGKMQTEKRSSRATSARNDDVHEESNLEHNYPKLKSRAIPGELVNAISTMGDAHKRAVREIGFGHILNLNVHLVPTHMEYWVLDSFDAHSCEIKFSSGRSIVVDADDVHYVFGFLKGGETIHTRRRSDVFDEEDKWYKQFDRTKGRVLLSRVREKMMEDVDGGDVFKKNFLVLLTSTLIENGVNGYVSPHLMYYMDKLDSIPNLDWCEYIVRSLIEHNVIWARNKTNYFGGPILFLTVWFFTITFRLIYILL